MCFVLRRLIKAVARKFFLRGVSGKASALWPDLYAYFISSRSIFAARDEYWKKIRNMLTPTFSAGKMKLMVPLIEKSYDVLMEKLERIAAIGERSLIVL